MRHHSTSIVGPDIDGNEQALWAEMFPKHTTPVKDAADPDPYPSDLLAACPMAREWGVVLETNRPKPNPFIWTHKGFWWDHACGDWFEEQNDSGVRHSRESAIKYAPTKPPPGYVAPPAQPSVGERLAKVAFETMFQEEELWYDGQSPSRKRDWLNTALAARREVLKEGFAEEDTEAAAKAFWNATLPGIAWDELREASRKPIRVQAAAAISAALASRAKRAEREDRQ